MMKYLMRLLVDVAPSVCPRGLRGRTRDLKLPSGVEHLERGEDVILNCKDNRSQQNKAPFSMSADSHEVSLASTALQWEAGGRMMTLGTATPSYF